MILFMLISKSLLYKLQKALQMAHSGRLSLRRKLLEWSTLKV